MTAWSRVVIAPGATAPLWTMSFTERGGRGGVGGAVVQEGLLSWPKSPVVEQTSPDDWASLHAELLAARADVLASGIELWGRDEIRAWVDAQRG